MTVSDVNIVPMSPAAALVALQHEDVDAVSIWQPFRYNFAIALGDNGIQFQNEGIYPARIYLIATKDTVSNRAEDLRALFLLLPCCVKNTLQLTLQQPLHCLAPRSVSTFRH